MKPATHASNAEMAEGTDCSHEAGPGPHRCGAPFADLHDLLSADRLGDVPDEVRLFLQRYVE